MSNTLWIGTLALTTTVALGAQTSSNSPTPQHVTVTGCIERGATQAPVGTTATTADTTQAPGPDTKFVLARVATETKATGTTGEHQPGSIADARSYRLDDSDESRIAQHVGQTVEISGIVEEQTQAAVGPTGTTAPADAIAPKLKVDTLRVVSSDCSRR